MLVSRGGHVVSTRTVGFVVLTTEIVKGEERLDLNWDGTLHETLHEANASAAQARSGNLGADAYKAVIGWVVAEGAELDEAFPGVAS